MTEEWRAIPGFEDCYEVSSIGRVRSLPRQTVGVRGRFTGVTIQYKGKMLALTPHPDGYRYVQLHRSGRRKMARTNRLVLMAFVGDKPGMEACHRNGDPTDDRLGNLYWGTKSDNQLDSVRHGTHSMVKRTECPKGHRYDEANTMLRPNGYRRCLECERKWARDRQRRLRESEKGNYPLRRALP